MATKPPLCYQLKVDEEIITQDFYGKTIRFPGAVKEDLDFILRPTAFRVMDMNGILDEESCLILVSSLVEEGFLEVMNY